MTTQPAAITVAIPTFNRRPLLERAIASVLDDTRAPVLVRVFDNASSDGTAEYVSALAAQDPRVSYFRRESNIGGLRNIAGSIASVGTEYFVPLADDDYLLPGFIDHAYPIMQADPELGAVVFGTEARAADGRLIEVYPAYLAHSAEGRVSAAEHLRLWLRHGHCAWSSILWRSSVLEQVGVPYDGLGLPGDVDFQAQVFARFPAYLVNRPGAAYSIHGGQASNGLDITHLPDWDTIFARLDRVVASGTNGLDFADYLVLRELAWKRLRGVWNRPTQMALPRERQLRLALIAGFKLGDWPLAHSLADGAAPAEAVAQNPRLWWLPPNAGQDTGSSVYGDRSDLLLALMRWFTENASREQASTGRLAEQDVRLPEAEAARAALELDVARGRQREAAQSTEIEMLRRRCHDAEQRLPGRRVQRLWARLTRGAPPNAEAPQRH